ncbi:MULTISPECIES: hypothetical protein [unclassified Embleya]|uniref:hypothetical protein n=1 Tax=unclassified Embleya TaxID=2699296 RepID=UPI0033D9CA08
MDLWFLLATAVAAGGTGAALGMRWSNRRRGARSPRPPSRITASGEPAVFSVPPELLERARAELLAWLRADVSERLAELTRRTQALVPAGRPAALAAQLRALDAGEAASWVLRDADDLPDLAGAWLLVWHGVRALEVAAEQHDATDEVGPDRRFEVSVCLFNPLHGAAHATMRWAMRGLAAPVPACWACLIAGSERTMPDILTARVADGAYLPYYEIPAEQSVWSATGYGAFGGDLVEQVRSALPGGRRAVGE